MDPRIEKLADVLVNYSVKVKKNENVMVECTGDQCVLLMEAVVNQVFKAGGFPFYNISDERIDRNLLENSSPEMWKMYTKIKKPQMKKMDCYIAIRGQQNIFQGAGIDPVKIQDVNKLYRQPVHHKEIVDRAKWVVLRYPSPSFAQSAQMHDRAFEEFFFRVCTLDYEKLSRAMDPLKEFLEKSKEVHLVGDGTDITINIEGMPWIKCDGEKNIPDGEIYTAPVKDRINGTITYNTKTVSDGKLFSGIRFDVKNGKIIDAGCETGSVDILNTKLDTDKGARYFGEFAFGVNPFITYEIMDTLFDEKILASNHLTPGNSYTDADNGNRSAVHWDLVIIGADVYVDGKLIRKGKEFIIDELKCLNQDNFL